MLSVGDTLGSYTHWKPGIMLQGLWITLLTSMYSIGFGIIIGLIGGVCRISPNPALRWTAMTYVELVRGSPLLVQIFIWYFVLGTVINTMLANRKWAQLSPLWFGVAALACMTGIGGGIFLSPLLNLLRWDSPKVIAGTASLTAASDQTKNRSRAGPCFNTFTTPQASPTKRSVCQR